MRTKIELLKLLRRVIVEDTYFESGICHVLTCMNTHHKQCYINDNEYILISDFIFNNRPGTGSILGYWWNPGLKEPRIEWLDSQIKKLQNVN